MKILSKNSLFTKSLILIMALTFICQNIAFSEHISSQVVPNYKSDSLLTNLHIPESYGKIEKVNNSGEFNNSTPESPQVVLIRDVHCNYEAQSNIAKILNILINDHKIDMVCIEGADGGLDPSRIAAYCDDSKIRQKVTDKYLRNGLLTASEALSINRGAKPGFTIWGIENLRLYLKDYQAFRRTIETNGETTHFVKLLSYIISHLKKKLYPEKLQKFDFEINKYEINEIPLTNFIKFLSLTKPLIPKEYPTLDLVLRTIALEEKIYFEKVENERSALIKHLEQQLPKEDLRELIQKSLLFKLGKISQADYYSYLEDYYGIYGETAGFPFENLEKYFELVKLQTQIDEKALFKELEIFRESIYTDFLPDENARRLHQSDKDVNILTKIVNLEATREDFEYYNINRHKFKPGKLLSFIKILARTNNISIPPELEDPAFLAKIDTTLLPPEDFYNLAMERDDAIVENFLNTIKKHEKKAAVLIVGGFHTDGIKMKLLRKGISLIVVTPILTKPQEDSRELYMARMMDERIKPEMILAKLGLENFAPPIILDPVWQEFYEGIIFKIISDMTKENLPAEQVVGLFDEFLELLPQIQRFYESGDNTLKAFIESAVKDFISAYSKKSDVRNLVGKLGIFEHLLLNESVTARIKYINSVIKPTTLKAPGSEGLDEDSGAKKHIESIIRKTPAKTETRQYEGTAVIIHKLKLGSQLGIPRKEVPTKPQDLVYAFGRKESDGRLHIYVTTAFWEEFQKNPLMLAFLIDHEWQENILGKSHKDASTRAWNFIDKDGMNPFYKFFINQLADAEEIEYLQKLTDEHLNDPRGKFRDYVLETLAIKIPLRLQQELDKHIIDGNIKQVNTILLKLKKIHNIIEELLTEHGTISTLVFEKLENILFDILREGNVDAKVNLMCIALPMALLNPRGYEVANNIKRTFYAKVREYIASKKPPELKERGLRQAYAQLSGQYYGFSKTRLFVIGLSEDDFTEVKKLFGDILLEVAGIKDTDNYPIYAGHMLVSLEGREDIRKKFTKGLYKSVSNTIEEIIVDAIKETTGRAEVSEKGLTKDERQETKDVLGQKHNSLLKKYKKAIKKGCDKFIPENEYETGKIPRLGHEIGYLNQLWDEIEVDKADLYNKCNVYSKHLNKSILRAFQDIRYKRAYKKPFSGAVVMAWNDGTLSDYIRYLKEKGLDDVASEWDCPLKMTKIGDEIWIYLQMDNGKIVQIFLELDKFNAFNEQYPPDAKDSFYHQILDSIFELHRKINRGGRFTMEQAESFANRIENAILNPWITIPDDEIYRNGYTAYSKEAVIDWHEKGRTFEIRARKIQSVKTGERIRLRHLRFHYTEKLKGTRVPLFIAVKGGKMRKVIVYERRIYTADGKEDITDELLSAGWVFEPVIGRTGAAVTPDLHSLANLDPYIISNMNTYYKKRLRRENKGPMGISEIAARRIIAILKKHDITDLDVNALAKVIIEAKSGNIKIDFMELWELIKERFLPQQFFEIAISISKPLNALLGPEADVRGAQMMNAILYEILEELEKSPKFSGREKERIKQTIRERLTSQKTEKGERHEAELLETIKVLAEKKGIDPNAIQSIFDLFKQGIDILSMDPGLDIGKIDESYFTLIEQLGEITGLSQGVIMKAFRKEFGEEFGKVPRTRGQLIEGSLLWNEVQRLTEYNKKDTGNYPLAEVNRELWDSDFHNGRLVDKADNKRNRYLSALDVVSKDTKKILSALKDTPIKRVVESTTPVGVILHIKDYITFHRDGTFSYKPGIETVFKHMEKGINIAFIVPKNLESRAETALKATGKFETNIFTGSSLKEAHIKLLETKIKPENIAYITNKKETKKPGFKDKIKGLKTVVITKDSAFHASLVFAVLYARARANEVTTLIWHFLNLMGYEDNEIRKIISDLKKQGFFTIRLIRIADTLREFQNRMITIDVAA